jgi:DNA polymerase elongation subunit (family B)
MIDRDISGAGWLTLPQGTYQVRTDTTKKQTHCQLEVDVTYNDIIPRKSEGEWNKIAPLRVLSVDIECQGRKGHFPEAEKDPVIQIANVVSVYGQGKAPIVQVCVCKLPSSLLLFCLIQSSQSNNPSLSCRVPVECFYVERVPSYCRRSSDFQRRGGGHAYEVEAVPGNMRS